MKTSFRRAPTSRPHRKGPRRVHYFSLHIGDYVAATAHLTLIEDGAYGRLLRRYYQDERPLPADVGECQRLAGARSKEERRAVETVLREFFTLSDTGWCQKRTEEEIAAYHRKAETARTNGRGGGRPKGKPTRNPVGSSSETKSKPTEKLTTNQEPLTNPDTSVSGERTAKRATRIPPAWRPDDAGRSFAADCGLDPESTADAFTDYWTAASGRTSAKLDWNAAFRTWCRRDSTGRVGPAATRPVQPSRGGGAYLDQLAVIARRADADERDRS